MAVELNHKCRFICRLPEEWRIEKLTDLAENIQVLLKDLDFDVKTVVRALYIKVANVLDCGFDLGEIKDIELLGAKQVFDQKE